MRLLTIFYYENNFEEAFRFARERGLRPFVVVEHMHRILDRAPERLRRAVDEYVDENQSELFESREACVAWAEANYDELVHGEQGGNLLSKYAMIGRFVLWQEALELLEAMIGELLPDDDAEAREMLRGIIGYYRAVMLHVPFAESLEQAPAWETEYDVEAWRRNGYASDLSNFRHPVPQRFATSVDPRVKSVLLTRLGTFGEHPQGLGRFTRTMFAQDFRRRVEDAAEVRLAAG